MYIYIICERQQRLNEACMVWNLQMYTRVDIHVYVYLCMYV